HIAKDEAISWRVALDASLFPALDPPRAAAPEASAKPLPKLGSVALPPRRPARRDAFWAGIAGLALALLVWLKASGVEAACALRQCHPRPLVPWSGRYRAPLAGAAFALAVGAVLDGAHPLPAAGALLLAMALGTYRMARGSAEPHGSGQWQT